MLIDLFRQLHINIEDNFCLSYCTIQHSPPDLTATLSKLQDHIVQHEPHTYKVGRKVQYLIDDKLRKGAAALMKVVSAVNHKLGEGILELEGWGT